MEERNSSGEESQQANHVQVGSEPQRVNSSAHKIKRFIKKYILIIVAICVILAALVAWQITRSLNDAAWSRATDFFTRAEYEKAENELKNMSTPSDVGRLRVYGQTMLATRHLDKSLEAYKKLYDIDKDPTIKLIIGNIYNEQKKYDDAIKIYREVIAANPSNVQAYVNIATVYKLQNNTSDAIAISSDGVKNNPSSVVLHELKVSMLMDDTTSQEYTMAVNELRELDPQSQLLQSLNEI